MKNDVWVKQACAKEKKNSEPQGFDLTAYGLLVQKIRQKQNLFVCPQLTDQYFHAELKSF